MTRSRFGLLALVLGVLVGAGARRSARPQPAAHTDLLALGRESRRTDDVLRTELHAVESRARRRAALTVALIAVAVLPAIAVAVRPDLDAAVAATLVGTYAIIAVTGLLVAVRSDRPRRRS